MYFLYDTFFDTPILVGTYQTLEEARAAARHMNENTCGRFRPRIQLGAEILKNWTY